MTANKFLALQLSSALRRLMGFVLMGAAAVVLSAATARAQNTQVTIEGTITSVASLPGVTVGDKYSMVVYYSPDQAPLSTSGTIASYTGFTLNAVVDDKHGNQNFSAESAELLEMDDASGNNLFASLPCCSTSTGAGFALVDTTGTAFTTDALPTVLPLKDFNNAFVVFGDTVDGLDAVGDITSIRVVNIDGIRPVFLIASLPDPNGILPAFNLVPGAGTENLDIGIPLTLLTRGSSYVYIFAFENINFSNDCEVSFTLTQLQYNKSVTIDSGTAYYPGCPEGGLLLANFTGKALPDYPGPATLTATVTYINTPGVAAKMTTAVVVQ